MKIRILMCTALATWTLSACLPVAGDRIYGADLARADARFAGLPETLTIAFAPVPGTQRVFASAELLRLARANGLKLNDADDLCFEFPMRALPEPEALDAMRRVLPSGSNLKMIELQKTDVPAGQIEFPIAGLGPAVQGVQLWRGWVRYSTTQKLGIWARVNITVKFAAVVAGKDLPRDTVIEAGHLRVETFEGPMLIKEPVAARPEDVVGRLLMRPVRAGEAIPLAALERPLSIRRGQPVRVEVQSGHARLAFDAVAERDGRAGDVVDLRNPSTGKIFKARLNGSHAVIVVSTGAAL